VAAAALLASRTLSNPSRARTCAAARPAAACGWPAPQRPPPALSHGRSTRHAAPPSPPIPKPTNRLGGASFGRWTQALWELEGGLHMSVHPGLDGKPSELPLSTARTHHRRSEHCCTSFSLAAHACVGLKWRLHGRQLRRPRQRGGGRRRRRRWPWCGRGGFERPRGSGGASCVLRQTHSQEGSLDTMRESQDAGQPSQIKISMEPECVWDSYRGRRQRRRARRERV
jgi:hypothetical protein